MISNSWARPRPHSSIRRRATLAGIVASLGIAAAAVLTATAPAQAATTPILSVGPLTQVAIGDDLGCAVNHTGDSTGEWYGQTACGTLVSAGGTLYGPASIPAGGNAGQTAFTPVSQTPVTGTGTAADPYTVVTVVVAGDTGLKVTQKDTYVVGEESYTTLITLANTGAGSLSGQVYRAGDCYLQDSDTGYGLHDPTTGAVSCTTSLDPGSRIEQMQPITAGSNQLEGFYGAVWAAVGTQQPLPNTCDCSTLEDNGIAISWPYSVAAGGQASFNSLVTFSPLGRAPLTVAKTADAASVVAGGADGYTITVSNPNVTAVTVTLTDTLAAGFAYTPGSTTGATTADPVNAGGVLSWSGVSVPAGGQASLHFGVTVSTTPGTYTDDADGSSDGYTVIATGPTAPVTVTAPVHVNTPPVANNATFTTAQDTAVATLITASDADGDAVSYTVVSAPSHGTLSGTAPALTYTPTTGYSGSDSFTFRANDGTADSNVATVTISVTPAAPPVCAAPVQDFSATSHVGRASDRLTSPGVRTTGTNDLLVALIGADGPTSPTQYVTGVSGGGLHWSRAVRSNSTWGTTEVWVARASSQLHGVQVTAKLDKSGFDGTITVVAYSGASGVGQVASAAGTHGAPTATLSSLSCGSIVVTSGHDWTYNTPIATVPGQTLLSSFNDTRVHDWYWAQKADTPSTAGGSVTMKVTGPTHDRWTVAAVEILPAS